MIIVYIVWGKKQLNDMSTNELIDQSQCLTMKYINMYFWWFM